MSSKAEGLFQDGGFLIETQMHIVTTLKSCYWVGRMRVIVGLTKLGELTGQEWLTYHPLLYEHFWDLARDTAPPFATALVSLFPSTRSIADFGCGTGNYVAAFCDRGIEAKGFEYSKRARRIAAKRLKLRIDEFDLTKGVPRVSVDIAMSLEVAEHLPPQIGDTLVDLLVRSAPLVVFSAAHPGQGGHGHINEQPAGYWDSRFARHAYKLDDSATSQLSEQCRINVTAAPWLADNVRVYRRQEPETVVSGRSSRP